MRLTQGVDSRNNVGSGTSRGGSVERGSVILSKDDVGWAMVMRDKQWVLQGWTRMRF